MFSLIITIISIALVAALALATLYYGGAAFNRGQDNARAAQILSAAQQIDGALTLMSADTVEIDSGADTDVTVADIGVQYLRTAPALPGGAVYSVLGTVAAAGDNLAPAAVTEIEVTGVPATVCAALNTQLAGSCAAGTFTFAR